MLNWDYFFHKKHYVCKKKGLKAAYNKFYIAVLVVFTFLLYSQTISYPFIHWDDDKQVTDNPRIKQISKENISHNFQYERYTAVSLYSYMADYYLWGQNPAAFRMVNILLHILNTVLVFILISLLLGNRRAGFFAALLFACHPLRVESVVWISERKDVLFAFWGLLALLAYRKYLVTELRGFYILAFALSLLSAFSKIQGILIPASFFLIDYWYKRKVTLRMATEKLALLFFIFFIYSRWAWLLMIVYFAWFMMPEKMKKKLIPGSLPDRRSLIFIFTGLIITGLLGYIYFTNTFGIWELNTPSKSSLFGFGDRLFLATYSFSHYLVKFIAPFTLSAVYPYPSLTDGSLPLLYYISSLVILPVIVFIYLAFKNKSIGRIYIFGLAFFALNISIVLHILPIEGRLVVADRYTYLAYTGLFLIAGWLLATRISNLKIQWLIILVATGLLSARNITRQPVWQNTGTLFTDVLEKDSSIAFAVNNLAVYEMYGNRLERALELINRSVALDSTDPMAWYNRGLILFNLKQPREAIISYETMMKHAYLKEDTALAMNDMGQCYLSMGNTAEGVTYLRRAISISDKIPSGYNNLGWYYYLTSQPDSAEIMFRKALKLNPDYPEALNNMGSLLFSLGKGDSALWYFNLAIRNRPSYALPSNNKGYYYLMKNDLNSALQSFNKAIEADPNFLEGYLNRAWIYYNQKQYDKAINDYNYILVRDSNYVTAYTNRGFSLFMLGKKEEAMKDFNAVIRIQPSNPEAFLTRGRAYLQNREPEKAVADFTSALAIKETDLYFQQRGIAYAEMKNMKMAEKDLWTSLAMNKENAETWYYLGRILMDNGDKKAGCECIVKSAGMGYQPAVKEAEQCR
jgi:tetratricopeptide (TPR) repeat protein